MTDTAARLKAAIKAGGVPIDEVVIGDEENRSTWRVQPSALQAQAQPFIDAYTPPTPNTLFDEFAELRLNEKAIKAWAKALWEAIPAPLTDWNATKQRAKTIFKNGNGA